MLSMLKRDFWYDLPKELIAQEPVCPRDAARLMVLNQKDDSIQHRIFRDLPEYLEPGDLLVVNNSKVLPARIVGVKQPTGAVCELLLLRQVKGDQWECLAKPGKRMQPGTKVSFGDGSLTAIVDETLEDGNKFVTFYYDTETLYEKLDEFGKMPLPPYITKQLEDQSQYQTVYAKELGRNIPICLHLDHGDTFELCKSCIDMGFSSVMIDGSHLPYDENVALTRKVVEYAHQFDVTVEGELGVLAGIEDEVSAEHHTYTEPDQVVDFVTKTGVDSLAISIGTSHGANKFRPEQCTRNAEGVLVPPPLRFDILEEIEKRIPGFPIVLHGSSSVPQKYVDIINKYGGAVKDAIGIPEDQLRKAAESAVCKINIDSDGRLAMTAAVRLVLTDKPAEFDPRKYLGPAREEMKKLYMHKCEKVLGSAGKA